MPMAQMTQNPVFVAIDTTVVGDATTLAARLHDEVGGIKLGLEFFARNGHKGVKEVCRAGALPLFLDLKFHDIPNTVAGAVRAVMPLAPALLNVHACGGRAMMIAAREAAQSEALALGITPPKMIAVTVLTSMDEEDLGGTGVAGGVLDQVRRLAALTRDAGLDGVVCSAREARVLRADLGDDFLLVTPGVRPLWSTTDDQKRVVTPQEAMAEGADVLVIGRPITGAADPAQAARLISGEIVGWDVGI
ncbi:orotidine-5'-phosphate decarboxylase [Rhodospirillum rubrum]|uniref:orotidine-5'-phosphate decarboxylase n=1 Tax=Rhodospirillum rubrum TaxID=1085 RepID=UPI001902E1EC|nr:orotidine-5'-phosphate decarboxylase [Rhodospirillum rubrum]MBK1665822.1 orotidine-5'-phosphate decarboxylase [Rhodospirillum rubrum]MBK1678227.1 orotidine-5'-phosphate decarboxylase [Rhodospirillum rubrum]